MPWFDFLIYLQNVLKINQEIDIMNLNQFISLNHV